MKTRYYKLIRGYDAEQYIEIEESELDKAYYCFLEKKDSVFSGGAIRGSQILAIQPDFHRTMGWNRGYRLESVDYEDLRDKGVDRKMQNALSTSKERVDYLMRTNQLHLLGKPVEGFDEIKKVESRGGVSNMADLLKGKLDDFAK